MQNELDQLMKALRESKEANTVKSEAPQSKRTFAYRKSPAIRAQDVAI